ncbi:hypothetical protein AHIS1_p076 [Acaryochloris phage A-HIS1]|nr:hypothetical protein AHIS1_p076 [Acaryochloris phage A-HIS1]
MTYRKSYAIVEFYGKNMKVQIVRVSDDILVIIDGEVFGEDQENSLYEASRRLTETDDEGGQGIFDNGHRMFYRGSDAREVNLLGRFNECIDLAWELRSRIKKVKQAFDGTPKTEPGHEKKNYYEFEI